MSVKTSVSAGKRKSISSRTLQGYGLQVSGYPSTGVQNCSSSAQALLALLPPFLPSSLLPPLLSFFSGQTHLLSGSLNVCSGSETFTETETALALKCFAIFFFLFRFLNF